MNVTILVMPKHQVVQKVLGVVFHCCSVGGQLAISEQTQTYGQLGLTNCPFASGHIYIHALSR